MNPIVVSASFDDFRSRHARLLDEASRTGPVHVLLWSDAMVQAVTGKPPTFPQEEREYLVQAIRFVSNVSIIDGNSPDTLPEKLSFTPAAWAVGDTDASPAKQKFCRGRHLELRSIASEILAHFPARPTEIEPAPAGRKKVVVTGCYDWFHSGHVRFFEEVSELGELYVVVGHDENIRHLKGEGHPLIRQDERRYVAGCIRYVRQALISTGMGWMDAEPEFLRINPDMYAVNEDGNKPEKREFSDRHGIQYVVLKRLPKPGLPRRMSTALRGF
ncbi:MAG: adenylyltransferase/cytidyltransferase family protein [Tepidisphaerales bacterium]